MKPLGSTVSPTIGRWRTSILSAGQSRQQSPPQRRSRSGSKSAAAAGQSGCTGFLNPSSCSSVTRRRRPGTSVASADSLFTPSRQRRHRGKFLEKPTRLLVTSLSLRPICHHASSRRRAGRSGPLRWLNGHSNQPKAARSSGSGPSSSL